MSIGNPFQGWGFYVSGYDLWVCLIDEPSICSEYFALIREANSYITCVAYSRISDECIGPYRALIFDPTPPDVIGFLATISQILAESKIPIMAYSTYYRDIILVPAKDVERAIQALVQKGFTFQGISLAKICTQR